MPRMLLLLALALLLAACGSTVRQTGPGVAGVDEGVPTAAEDPSAAQGSGAMAPGSVTSVTGASGQAGSAGRPAGAAAVGGTSAGGMAAATGGSVPVSTGGSSSPSGVADAAGAPGAAGGGQGTSTGPVGAGQAPAPSADAAAAGEPARGVSDDEIRLGVVVLQGGEAFSNGLGLSISFGDGNRQSNALIDELNARGGINGRRVVAVPRYWDVASADPQSNQEALCTQFAEDEEVFAVITPLNPLPTFVACMARNGLLLLNASALTGDDELLAATAPYFLSPSLKQNSRWPEIMVDTLARDGFFDGARVQMVVLDDPIFTRVAEQVMRPAFESRGIEVVLESRVRSGGDSQADINAAVLRAKTEGVTHVVFLQSAGGVPLYYMQTAEVQQFHPLYGLSSYDVPGYLLQDQVPAAQLAGSRGIGWQAVFDVKPSEWPTTPQEQRCLDIIEGGGEANEHRNSSLTATLYCDLVWSFEAIAGAAGSDLNLDTFLQGYRTVGTSFDPVITFATDWTQGRPDGSAAHQLVAYEETCSCFRYTSNLIPDPA